jgi:hypothetical protein
MPAGHGQAPRRWPRVLVARQVAGGDHDDGAGRAAQADPRHRAYGRRRLPRLDGRPARSQDQHLGADCALEQRAGGRLVDQLRDQPTGKESSTDEARGAVQ